MLGSPLLLSRATEREVIFLYLAVSPSAVSSVPIREDQRVQKPVYFSNRALCEVEEQYPRIEKLAFALIVSARKLRPYFKEHTIRVLTEYPLKKVLQKLDISRRFVNWAVELEEFDIDFLPWTAIKRQTSTDFLAKFCGFPEEVELAVRDTWVACMDRSSTRKRNGVVVVLIVPEGECLEFAILLAFATTKNEAEYEPL